jgi:hypothetical protein
MKPRFKPFQIILTSGICIYPNAKKYSNKIYDVIAEDSNYWMISLGKNEKIWESAPPPLTSLDAVRTMISVVENIELYIGKYNFYFINKKVSKKICQDCL